MLLPPEPLTSYQMRRQEIAYLRQRSADLEALIFGLLEQLVEHDVEPAWPILPGITGAQVMTDVSSGDFDFKMMSAIAGFKKAKETCAKTPTR